MATFTRLASGKWRAQVRRNGQYAGRSFTTKGQAETWARKVEMSMEDDTWQGSSPIAGVTLSDLLDRYEKSVTVTKKSAVQERQKIRTLQGSPFGSRLVADLKPIDLANWRDERLQEVKSGTVLRYLALLSDVFNHARREWGMPIENPVAGVRKPQAGKPRERRLKAVEEEAILRAADEHSNPEFRVIVRLALYTAMRQGEILGMLWENVHVGRRVIYLPDTKNGESRGVPLSSRAIEAIQMLEAKSYGRVFSYTRDGFRTVWQRMIRKLGIDDLTFHDFRHEATSRLVERGLDVLEVASITGHKTLQMLKRYTHLRAEELARKLD